MFCGSEQKRHESELGIRHVYPTRRCARWPGQKEAPHLLQLSFETEEHTKLNRMNDQMSFLEETVMNEWKTFLPVGLSEPGVLQ